MQDSEKLKEALEILKTLNGSIATEDDVESIRKDIIQAKALLNKRLSETSKTEFVEGEIRNYCKELIEASINNQELPEMPESVENKKNSKAAAPIIKGLLAVLDLKTSTPLLAATYKEVSKAKSVTELKASLKVYVLALETETKITEMQEHIQWLAEMVDSKEKDSILYEEAKRQNNELIGIFEEDDEDISIVLKAGEMKETLGLTDVEISKVLGIDRSKLNRLRTKFASNI